MTIRPFPGSGQGHKRGGRPGGGRILQHHRPHQDPERTHQTEGPCSQWRRQRRTQARLPSKHKLNLSLNQGPNSQTILRKFSTLCITYISN